MWVISSIRKWADSIHFGIFVPLVLLISLVWIVSVGASVYNIERRITESLDDQLSQAAYFVWLRAEQAREQNFRGIEDLPKRTQRAYGNLSSFAFQVWDGTNLLTKSDTAPENRMAGRPGSSNGQLDGSRWRFYYRIDWVGGLDVIVGARNSLSQDAAILLAVYSMGPMAVGLILIFGLSYWAIWHGIKHLRHVAGEIKKRSPSDMQPIDASKAPSEVQAITSALNRFFGKLDVAIEGERRFTADASHELRTPLAAIETFTEVLRRAKSEEDQANAVAKIKQSIDRSRRVIDQLLILARLDPDETSQTLEEVDLRPIVERELQEIASQAFAKNIDLELEAEAVQPIQGDPGCLSIMIRNLLDNAARYAPENGTVMASLSNSGRGIELAVSDSGHGIPEDEKDNVWNRFYRVQGTKAEGAGLGLSIVSKIAELHGAKLILENGSRLRGLCVRVLFPTGSEMSV